MISSQIKAPPFHLRDQNNHLVSLSDFKGSYVYLYFFKDINDLNCQYLASKYSDIALELARKGVVMLGISENGVKDLHRWSCAIGIEFTLLSDSRRQVMRYYDAYRRHITFSKDVDALKRCGCLINEYGVIIKTYKRIDLFNNSDRLLSDIDYLLKKTKFNYDFPIKKLRISDKA